MYIFTNSIFCVELGKENRNDGKKSQTRNRRRDSSSQGNTAHVEKNQRRKSRTQSEIRSRSFSVSYSPIFSKQQVLTGRLMMITFRKRKEHSMLRISIRDKRALVEANQTHSRPTGNRAPNRWTRYTNRREKEPDMTRIKNAKMAPKYANRHFFFFFQLSIPVNFY